MDLPPEVLAAIEEVAKILRPVAAGYGVIAMENVCTKAMSAVKPGN